jgi:C4-dicarboxylate-specific signal transduction histidine kinase
MEAAPPARGPHPSTPDLTGVLEAMPYACAAFAQAAAGQPGDGELIAANAAFTEAFGGLGTILHRNDFEAALRSAELDGDAAGERDEVYAPHNDRWYTLHWAGAAVGGCDLQLLTATDISARQQTLGSLKAQQEQLLFTSRLMSVGEMTATLAHELNQPLAAIINYLNGCLRLLEHSVAPAQVLRAIEAARGQAEHASAVIGRIREFIRAREPRRDACALVDISDSVLRLLKLEAEQHRVQISTRLAQALPPVYADRVMIEQVLLNLVKNGIEAMRDIPQPRRVLAIEARLNLDDSVEVRVLDRGCGLAEADRAQLFSPFFTTKAEGLGIGLAICRSIIEYHEGRLYFEPREEGGSAFVFTLPRADRRMP